MAVRPPVGAGAGDVLPQAVPVIFEEGVESGIESLAVVDGIKARLEGFPQFFVRWPKTYSLPLKGRVGTYSLPLRGRVGWGSLVMVAITPS